jgi:hypothetical protein
MPKIEITDSKGLVQKTGSGVDVQSVGLEGVIVSAETSIPVEEGTTDVRFSMPAGALITDFGFVVTSAVGGGVANGTMDVSLGTDNDKTNIVAAVTVADSNSVIAAGSSMSVLNAVKADASGAPFGDFVDASVLHSTVERAVTARFEQKVGAAGAIGKVFAYVKYTIVA